MKKFLLVLVILLAIAVAAGAVLFATFDINRFRPQILQQIKKATGKEARIGRMGLTWNNGIAARIEQVALYDAGDTEPDASLERAVVQVQLAPLLRKEVRVTGVLLSGPQLVVEKTADGKISVAGIRPPSSASPSAPSSANAVQGAAGAALQIDSVRIENGRFRYIDRSASAPLDVEISDFDADVKNVSPGKPVAFATRMAVFSSKQNIAVGGRVTPPVGQTPAMLDHFTLQADLSALDLKKLEAAVPAARSAGLRSISGLLEAKIAQFIADPAQLAGAEAEVTLKNGAVAFDAVALPVEDIQLEATLKNGNAEVRNLSARLADGTLQFQGTVQNITGRAESSFRATVRELALAKLAQAASAQAPRLEGHISLDFQGRALGLSGPQITQSLDGQGRLAMKDGVLVNTNLLRTVVEKLSKIPGVGDAAISRIPPQYLAKINEPHTVLRPFEAPFAVQQGRLFFDQLNVPTDLFLLSAAGSIGFDRSLAMQAVIRFDGNFSKALNLAAPPTQYFMNPAGQIELQMAIQGVPPDVQVKPNLDAALQRVGSQVVGDLLSKKDPKEILSGLLGGPAAQEPTGASAPTSGGIPLEPAVSAPQNAAPSEQPSTEDQLMQLLSGALNKNKEQ